MNFTLIPQLKYVALVRVTAALWDQDDIRMMMVLKMRSLYPVLHIEGPSVYKEYWQEVEDEVLKRALKLPLPGILRKELPAFVEAIGWQIFLWMYYHDDSYCFNINLPREFYWTPQGTINKKKTAHLLVENENWDIYERYRLACTYCMEDYVPVLWKQFKQLGKYNQWNIRLFEPPLITFWSHCVENTEIQLRTRVRSRRLQCTSYEFAFQCSALSGNEASTRYFLHKLTPEEKEKSLVTTAGYVAERRSACVSGDRDFLEDHATDVLCYLLSLMNEDQQKELLKNCPHQVLRCLLDWPWQDLFLDTAQLLWDVLSESEYDTLLRFIVNEKIHLGFKDHNYHELLRKFWLQSTPAHKNYVINEFTSGGVLFDLCLVKDSETFKFILNYVVRKKKDELILSNGGLSICRNLMRMNKWDLLEFFLKECLPLERKMKRFREEFKKRIKQLYFKDVHQNALVWKRLFQLVDKLGSN